MSLMKDESQTRPQRAEMIVAVCPACGTTARRIDARYCATCGRELGDSGYQPADALRASYHQQTFASHASTKMRSAVAKPLPRQVAGVKNRSSQKFVIIKHNGATSTAKAFVIYSLVPYLGILFCPGAILMGSVGLVRARRTTHKHGSRSAIHCVAFGLLIFGAQVFLWWLLYKVPEWGRP